MLKYVVDFDDLYDEIADRSLDYLLAVKDRYPDFKATLFTIPGRTSDATVTKYKAYPWLALAPHGWRHTRGECLSWTIHEAEGKLAMSRDKGIDAPAFRAPGWIISRPVYEMCRDWGLIVADHKDNFLHVPGCWVYRYNDPAWRAPKIRPVHGHLTNTPAVDNYIGDMATDGRLTFATEHTFLMPWEVGKEMGAKP